MFFMFFTRFHFPHLLPTACEKKINQRLQDRNRNLRDQPNKYRALLLLRKNASMMEANFKQLREISGAPSLESLRRLIEREIGYAVDDIDVDNLTRRRLEPIKYTLELVRTELSLDCAKDFFSVLFLANNAFLCALSVAGIAICAVALGTQPIGWIIAASSIVLVASLLLLAVAAYSMYVESRALFNVQIKEIEKGIDFLENTYPNLLAPKPELEQQENGESFSPVANPQFG